MKMLKLKVGYKVNLLAKYSDFMFQYINPNHFCILIKHDKIIIRLEQKS